MSHSSDYKALQMVFECNHNLHLNTANNENVTLSGKTLDLDTYIDDERLLMELKMSFLTHETPLDIIITLELDSGLASIVVDCPILNCYSQTDCIGIFTGSFLALRIAASWLEPRVPDWNFEEAINKIKGHVSWLASSPYVK